MKNLKMVLAAILLLFGWAQYSEACPKPAPQCKCDCTSKCKYGEICKKIKECVTSKICHTKKVCCSGKKVCCKNGKVKLCHIPPGNYLNAHTICVSNSAVVAHLGNHGDYLGECKKGCEFRKICTAHKCCKYITKCECAAHDPKCPICQCPSPQLDAGVSTDGPVLDSSLPISDSSIAEMDKGIYNADQSLPKIDLNVKPDAGVAKDSGRVLDSAVVLDDGVVETPDVSSRTDIRIRPPKQDAGVSDTQVVNDIGFKPDCCSPVDPKKVPNQPEFEMLGGGCAITSVSGDIGFIFFILGLLFILRKKALLSIVAFVMLLSFSNNAFAYPKNTHDDYFKNFSSDTRNKYDMSISLNFEYMHHPLRIVLKPNRKLMDNVIKFRQNMNFNSSFGVTNWFQIDLTTPIMLGQSISDAGYFQINRDSEDAAFYDMRISPKFNILKTKSFSLGLLLSITLPSGNDTEFIGENGATFTPTMLLGFRTDYVYGDVNLGYLSRRDQSFKFGNQTITVDDEFTYGFGLRVPLIKNHGYIKRLYFQGDVWGAVSVFDQDNLPIDIMGGLKIHLKDHIVFAVGVGAGLTRAVGTSEYRVMWGFEWEFEHPKKRPSCKTCENKEVIVVKKVVKKVVRIIGVVEYRLVLPPVFFAFNKTVVLEQSYPTLQTVAETLKKYKIIKEVVVNGYTDTRGTDKYNEKLGLRRAQNVKRELIKMGVDPKRMITFTYGESKNAVPNAKTKRGHARNRRVEFK